MDDDYTLLTPENVDLRFDVAGLGSRFAAALIDYTVLGIGYIVLILGAGFVLSFNKLGTDGSPMVVTTVALTILVTFFGWWGYFILTEMLWNGQSIGKRRLGLRVVRSDGQPINLTASLVRNLLRVVDLIGLIGVLVMIVDRRTRRLGDLAAGTLVIRESQAGIQTKLVAAFHPVEIPSVLQDAIDSFPNADRLSMDHYTLLRDFFARRSGLTSEGASRLAVDLATQLAESLGVDVSAVGDPVAFLATAARAFEARQRYRN